MTRCQVCRVEIQTPKGGVIGKHVRLRSQGAIIVLVEQQKCHYREDSCQCQFCWKCCCWDCVYVCDCCELSGCFPLFTISGGFSACSWYVNCLMSAIHISSSLKSLCNAQDHGLKRFFSSPSMSAYCVQSTPVAHQWKNAYELSH